MEAATSYNHHDMIKAQIIVCDQIDFDPELKKHTLNHIRNEITVEIVPSVSLLHVYVKLLFVVPNAVHVPLWLVCKNGKGETTGLEKLKDIKNMRASGLIPGIDKPVLFPALWKGSGLHYIQLVSSNEELAEYPLYVNVMEEEKNSCNNQ